jgi:acetyl esterase/lipase
MKTLRTLALLGMVFVFAVLCTQAAFAQQPGQGVPAGSGMGAQSGGGGPATWPTGTPPQPPPMDVSAYTRKWLDLAFADKSQAEKLDIYLPAEGTGPFPTIVYIHGGGWGVSDKRSSEIEPVLKNGLKHGYAVVSVNYRFSKEALFPAQIQDVKAAIRWLRANGAKYQLSTQKIAVWGSSSGGQLAALMGTSNGVSQFDDTSLGNANQSSRVQAALDVSGPINFLTMDDELIAEGFSNFAQHNDAAGPESKLVGGAVQTVPYKVRAANAENYISKESAPELIEYGLVDNSVAYMQATSLAEKLIAVIGKDKVGIVLFPEGGHGGGDAFTGDENMKKIFAFFDRYVR